MVAKSGESGARPAGDEPHERRKAEHVERSRERREREKPRAERLRAHAELLHDPGAEILERDDVTPPAAEEPAEDRRSRERDREEDEPAVHVAELERVHRLGRLDRREGAASDQIVREVKRDERVHADQDARAPLAALGLTDE